MRDSSYEELCTLAHALIAKAREDDAHLPADLWRDQSVHYHLEHAFKHIQKEHLKDTKEDHIAHAVTRLLFVAALKEASGAT